MARARTVISPPAPPRASKAKPKVEDPGWEPRPGQPLWRVRTPSDTNPQHITYCQDADEADLMASPGDLIEVLEDAVWGPPRRDVPTVAQLAEQGMARERDGRWIIDPLGQEILNDAMVGRDE